MSRNRWAALAGLTAALALYTAGSDRLWHAGLWPNVLFLSLVVIPATFLVVWLLLPAAFSRGLLGGIGLGLAALAVILRIADLEVLFNLAKLLSLIALGFLFLTWFETVAWAVLIAAIIPWVDIWSVFFGPTEKVTKDHPSVFKDVAIEFAIPGREEGARIGPPDILFFALFLAAAARFGLRVAWTWIGMTAMLAVTLILVSTTDIDGLPALPAICIGFLLPNADLIWHALRRRGSAPVRIYGRTDASLYDLEADVIERGQKSVIVLTRDRPPVMATIESIREGDSFPAEPANAPASELLCRLTIGGADEGEALVHDLPNGMVIVPRDENPRALYDVHPEQLAADEAKVERLVRERRASGFRNESETPVLDGLKVASIVGAYLIVALLAGLLAQIATESLLVSYVAVAIVSVITAAVLHPRAFPPGARNEKRWLVISVLFGVIAVTWLAWLSVTRHRWSGVSDSK